MAELDTGVSLDSGELLEATSELDAGDSPELETPSEEDVPGASLEPDSCASAEYCSIDELETCELSLERVSGTCVDESSPQAVSAMTKKAHAQDTAKERFITPNIQ